VTFTNNASSPPTVKNSHFKVMYPYQLCTVCTKQRFSVCCNEFIYNHGPQTHSQSTHVYIMFLTRPIETITCHIQKLYTVLQSKQYNTFKRCTYYPRQLQKAIQKVIKHSLHLFSSSDGLGAFSLLLLLLLLC
jgi:hypothetical protein